MRERDSKENTPVEREDQDAENTYAVNEPQKSESVSKESEDRDSRYKIPFIISLIVFVILLLLSAMYVALRMGVFDYIISPETETSALTDGDDTSSKDTEKESESETETESETEPLPENPINFSEQMALNDEIYAWINIPGTNVDYPILQSRTDDLYYLRRGVDGNYLLAGVLFSQSHNKRDFSDPVTLVYGHNMTEDGSMFATLHNFEDPAFFAEHETVYVYTPGHILTYRIVSAYKYDNRHIMNSFNFDDEQVRRDYFDYVMSPMMFPQNIREGVYLETEDKLLVLSTCMADNRYRYLVNAVLISDELTK